MTTKHAAHREPLSETEALRLDLEQTRQRLAGTVQELTRQLNVPRRVKESAGRAGQRMKDMPAKVKHVPAASRRHPKAAAAVGGAVALGVGAVAWMAGRQR
jgi:urease accessory protein UreF